MKTIEQNAEVGIIVARFQSPYLHEGHIDIITQVIANHPRVIIYLGLSSVKCSKNNPLDFAARKAMIEQKFPSVEVHYVEDVGNNEVWSKNLDRHISKIIGPNQKVVLYGSRDSFIAAYSGKFPTIELIPNKFISAREIRKNVGIKSKFTQEFREGVIWAVENQWPKINPTIDIAIINYEKKELLLAKKPNETKLRFVGGFIDPTNDLSAEDAALREGREETGLYLTDPVYLYSHIIDDWRFKNEQDKIMTFFYAVSYHDGTPNAQDDIAELQWISLSQFNKIDTMIEHSHKCLLFSLRCYLEKLKYL